MDDYLANPKSYLSTKTDSYARFVSTNTQSEALIKATTNLSLSTSAIGVSLGSGSTDNFKFGLTSTNFVIHYEIVENGYRTLGYNALNNAWQTNLSKIQRKAGKKIHKQYQRKRYDQHRIDWHAKHPTDHADYLSSAGDATITAEVSGDANAKAVFCYVKFLSCADNNKDDRKRELADGAPAVGKSSVGFEVKSGYGDDVNWNLYGTSIKMTPKDYPFQGLE